MNTPSFPEASSELSSGATRLSALERIRVVLVSPSHPGNIGATARAMKTMGLTRLTLVTPRIANALKHPEATALAVAAHDLLERAEVHDTLASALAGCSWAVALTARHRLFTPLEVSPRDTARHALALATTHQAEVALVFGNEQHGLDNDDVLTCQACCAIPTDPGLSSLNLAQAVQVMSYECRLAALEGAEPLVAVAAPLATIAERERLFEHLEEALKAIDFLNEEHPKKLMYRMRRIFSRSPLEPEEVAILRGVCTKILTSQSARTNEPTS